MRSVISLILVYCLAITSVFAQSVNPNDTLKIGKASSSSDKGLTFDTNDGVSNKKLLIEKISKKLKFDGNTFQIGDGSSSSDKELIIAGALKSLKYNGTSGEFEFNDDVKLSGTLKADFLQAVNTEVAINSLLRASQGIKVGAGANEIRVNAGNLEFSNDGVLYKKFGTGTGGGSTGVNLLTNDSFEDGISTGWTSSGGAFSQQTFANGSEGNLKFARFVASGAGQYFESTLRTIPTFVTGGCQADFKQVNVSANGLFKFEVLDSALNVLATANINQSAWIKLPTLSFVCPTAGTTVKIKVTSLAAGTLEVDKAYLGSNQNIVDSLCQGTLECEDEFSASMSNTCVVTNENMDWIQSTTNPSTGQCIATFKTGLATVPLNCTVSVSSGAQYFASILSSTSTTVGTQVYLDNGVTGAQPVNISCQKQGADFAKAKPQTSVSPEQASWFIDANIGGANPNLSSASVSSYAEILDSSLDLVLNSGSASAEIACASGTASTGLTCSSAESTGIAFFPVLTGLHEICFSASRFADLASNSTANSVFQVIETSNTSSSILTEGKQRISVGDAIGTGVAHSGYVPFKACGAFNFSDLSKKTFRLMYEQATGGTVNTSALLADRTGGNGQRDIHVSVRNLSFGQNRPILTGDQVTNHGAINTEIFGVSFGNTIGTACTTATCAYMSQIGDRVSSVTRTGVSNYVLNLNKTFSKVMCSGNAYSGSQFLSSLTPMNCINCNAVGLYAVNLGAAAVDYLATLTCIAQP